MQYTKWQNHINTICIVGAVLLAGFFPGEPQMQSASADTQTDSLLSSSPKLIYSDSGNVSKIEGLVIDGINYDVTFKYDSFLNLFGSPNSSDFNRPTFWDNSQTAQKAVDSIASLLNSQQAVPTKLNNEPSALVPYRGVVASNGSLFLVSKINSYITRWDNFRGESQDIFPQGNEQANYAIFSLQNPPKTVDTQAYSLWSSSPNSISPAIPIDPDRESVELGIKFSSNVPGKITAIQFYRTVPIDSGYIINLWDEQGNLLGNAMSIEGQQPTPGWQTVQLYPPVAIEAGKTYIASYYANGGSYPVNENFFQPKDDTDIAAVGDTSISVSNGPLYALCDRQLVDDEYKCRNGVYKYGLSGFPTETYKSSNYWVDVIFKPD
jgi:Domain of unknown function (DUF4082)